MISGGRYTCSASGNSADEQRCLSMAGLPLYEGEREWSPTDRQSREKRGDQNSGCQTDLNRPNPIETIRTLMTLLQGRR